MFTKLLSNIIGSIIKSSEIKTDVRDREYDIIKTFKVLAMSLLIVIIIFLLARVEILSVRVIHYHNVPGCDSRIEKLLEEEKKEHNK